MGAPDWFVDVFPIEKVENSSQRCVSLPEGNIKKKTAWKKHRKGHHFGVSKNRDAPKMDGENNGKPY